MYVQSFITNISFVNSIDELRDTIDCKGMFDIELILTNTYEAWTVPRWAQIGDIVFFYHAKYASTNINRIKKEITQTFEPTDDERQYLSSWLERASALHHQYGGRIFAIGSIAGIPFRDDEPMINQHWKSRYYASISNVHILEHPIALDNFSEYIYIARQCVITPVTGESFHKLQCLIIERNTDLPSYFIDSYSSGMNLAHYTKANWLTISSDIRCHFMLETQFRSYYTDYLLTELSDSGQYFYECVCYRDGRKSGTVDNVIQLMGSLLPVEIKLNIQVEKDLASQLERYLGINWFICSGGSGMKINDNIVQRYIIVVDMFAVYIYSQMSKEMITLMHLDSISNHQDIQVLRNDIINFCGL